jgi:hypothetical protein
MNVGRYFGYQKRVSIGFEFEKKDFVGDSTTIEFDYIAPQASMAYDTRDIYNDPSQGIYIFHSAQYFNFFNIKNNALFWNHSYSAFFSPIKGKRKTTIGSNITINSTHGNLHQELFKFGLGGGYSVRGWQIENPGLFQVENKITVLDISAHFLPLNSARQLFHDTQFNRIPPLVPLNLNLVYKAFYLLMGVLLEIIGVNYTKRNP